MCRFVNYLLCCSFPILALSSVMGSTMPNLMNEDQSREESVDVGKKRRQVFREDLSPLLGGKIPSGALEWTRLMFNNLDSRGISIPDGYLPSNDRIPPEGTRTEERRIRFSSNDMLVPHIDTTYTLRSPAVLPSLTAMAATRSSGSSTQDPSRSPSPAGTRHFETRGTTTTSSSKSSSSRSTPLNTARKGEKRRKGGQRPGHNNQEPKKGEMKKEDSVGKEQSRVIQYQRPRTNLELHVFSPKDMERLEQDYRNRLIDEILSLVKSVQTTSIHLLSPYEL